MNAIHPHAHVDTGLRRDLSDFSSILCFRALITGIERVLGRAAHGALVSAGKLRGTELVETLGLVGAGLDHAETHLRQALGADGTQLCTIAQIKRIDDETVVVRLTDTIESSTDTAGSDRRLSFTLGAIQGALEAFSGQTYIAKQTGSALRGQAWDEIALRVR